MVDNGGEIGAKKPLFFGFFHIRERETCQNLMTLTGASNKKKPANRPFSLDLNGITDSDLSGY